jgi:eukaryotic-like serine/threonine-protein kinase
MARHTVCSLICAGILAAGGCVTLSKPIGVTFQVDVPTAPSPLHFSLSPDGRDLVAWTASGQGLALWSRPMASLDGRIIRGTQRARGLASGFPFWSPDSEFIGSFGDHSLQVMDRRGGSLRTLAPAPFAHGGTWSRHGVIIYAPDENGPLYSIAVEGGTPRQVTALNASRRETAHRHPYFLPDGRHFLFVSVAANPENSGIWIGSVDSEEPTFLVSSPVKAVFAPPDTVLYVQGTSLVARAFNARRLELTGAPRVVVEDIATNERNSAAGFAVSANGALAYLNRRSRGASAPQTISIVVATNWRELQL